MLIYLPARHSQFNVSGSLCGIKLENIYKEEKHDGKKDGAYEKKWDLDVWRKWNLSKKEKKRKMNFASKSKV